MPKPSWGLVADTPGPGVGVAAAGGLEKVGGISNPAVGVTSQTCDPSVCLLPVSVAGRQGEAAPSAHSTWHPLQNLLESSFLPNPQSL